MKEMKKRLKLKQEKFAQLVAQGMSAAQAYVEAGYSNTRGLGANGNASALAKTPHVAARIAEIREMASGLGDALLTIAEKRRFLAEVVMTPVGSIGPESWLCQEFYEKVKVRKVPAGREAEDAGAEGEETVLRRRVKMVDKLRAIELDSKLAGHFAEADEDPEESGCGRMTVDLDRIREVAAQLGMLSPACAALFEAKRRERTGACEPSGGELAVS